jgi:hypothetical protein
MAYTLYNKSLERRLIHPKVGLWFSNDLAEAQKMLEACYEYLDATGLSDLKNEFIIVDAESDEEIDGL